MPRRVFRVFDGSLQEQFLNSTKKIQFYGGGYANGKTSATVIKVIKLAKAYPGMNALIARETYPKLKDTIQKEFIKWCPEHWIKTFPQSPGVPNTCVLTNGSMINFRYVVQQGRSSGGDATVSNLLSANYDLIAIDQIEDPGITEKDFMDLLGRLRGQAPFCGEFFGDERDRLMPKTGPRWMLVTSNPTRNWVYRRLVRPWHHWKKTQRVTEELIVDENGVPMMDLFEGSTYENKDNLAADYIATLESTYTGQMRDRYLMGLWAAYEGLVYPMYDEDLHSIPYTRMFDYYQSLIADGYRPTWIEGFDYGISSPSCYLLAFIAPTGDVCLIDGFYQAELKIGEVIHHIKRLRRKYTGSDHFRNPMLSDPGIFRRSAGSKEVVGHTVSDLLSDSGRGIRTIRGNNDIINGITKVQGYLHPVEGHKNPILGTLHAPYFYHSNRLQFFINEIGEYMWNRKTDGELDERPVDRNDHAMDALKYMLSLRPRVGDIIPTAPFHRKPFMTDWSEKEVAHGG